MQWVYFSGSEKPQRVSVSKSAQLKGAKSFFSSLFTSFSATPPQRSIAMLPETQDVAINPLCIDETSVSLSIFSADVAVRLEGKLSDELRRSTKKNPPNKLKYELIYVSFFSSLVCVQSGFTSLQTAKDEYNASQKDYEKQTFATGSIFQGLRADLDGYVCLSVHLSS
jgi:Protein of unknown function (DUF3684)